MLIDLHVHTSKYSKCGKITPEEMAATAVNTGLDGVVITEHNAIWREDELADLQQNFPSVLFMRAFEVSAADRHDVLVYGVPSVEGFYQGMPVSEVVALAHDRGGIAVLAHPFRYCEQLKPEVLASPFDAIETRSTNIDPYHHDACDKLAKILGLPEVYNSDGHHQVSIGTYCNDFHAPIRNEADLIQALRKRLFTPFEQHVLVEPALLARADRVKTNVMRCIQRGMTNADDIWKKVGNSRQLVNEILAGMSA